MANQTVSDESDENGCGDENSEFGTEEEEPSEEEPNEEDPDEEEPSEVDSGEELAEDFSEGGRDEENFCEQELDEVASYEVEPDEEDSCEEVVHEEEPDEEVCKVEQNDEKDQMEEPCEQISDKEPCEEEQEQESCEEEPDEEPCEEAAEEEEGEEKEEEEEEGEGEEEERELEVEEEVEVKEEEEEVEEEEEEVEEVEEEEGEEEKEGEEEEGGGGAEEEEEEPDEDPVFKSNEGSAAQSKSGKNMSSNTTGAPKRVSGLSDIQDLSSNINVVGKLSTTKTTGKKRRSRWDMKVDSSELREETDNIGRNKKKTRWSRWSNEDSKSYKSSSLKPPVNNLEVPNLLSQLFEITKKMQSGVVDDRPKSERSPSPPPLYNNLGIQINTREARFHSKLMIQRQKIISELIRKNPNFKPPPDYKSSKFQKKLYIPSKEYPEYNFVGLILGPSGNTQKRMQKETGAKILLRGKGAALNPKKGDPSDNEDLHVLIEADNKYSLDSAVAMVQKLLVPVEDGCNVHKLAQLRELAQMKGNLRGENTVSFKMPDPCDICGEASHPTSACPLTAPARGTSSNANQVNFLAEMGGGLSPFTVPTSLSSIGFSKSSSSSKPNKEIDDSKLYVGFLPHSVDDKKLIELFSPFGPLCEAKVIVDKHTGLNKGYGFVKYKDHINAAVAVSQMNKYKIDGKMLAVRIAGMNNNDNSNTGSAGHLSNLPIYPGPALAAVHNNPDPMSWPGPPESRLPETVGGSFSYSSSFQINRSPFGGLPDTTTISTSLFSRDLATSDELSQFPGYLKSLDSPPPPPPPPLQPPLTQLYHHQSTVPNSLSSSQDYYSSSLYSRDYFTQNYESYQRPPT